MEMQQIIEQAEQNIRQALKDYGRHTDQTQVLYDVSNCFIKRLAKDSSYAKQELRDLFSKSPVWDERLDALVINGTRTHNPDQGRIYDLGMEILEGWVRQNGGIWSPASDDVKKIVAFFSSKDEERKAEGLKVIRELAPKAYAPTKKLSRVFKAVCVALGIADETAGSDFQRLYAQFADELSAKKIGFKLYVSINPAHFLTMSNPKEDSRGCTLTSCHSFNSTEYDWNNGCAGYARDEVSFIVFTVDDPSVPELLNNRKTTRQIFAYKPGNGFLLQSRLYNTSGGTRGAQEDSKLYRDLVQREISMLEGAPNLWKTYSSTGEYGACVDAGYGFGGYKDWEYSEFDGKVSIRDDHLDDFESLVVGNYGLCICCGNEISKGLYCSTCNEGGYETCDCCGDSCQETFAVWGEDGRRKYVCESCQERYYTRCDECGEYYPNDSMTYISEGEEVCQSCLDRYYSECDCCGEYCRSNELHAAADHTGNNVLVCDDCLRAHYTKCTDCGEYFHDDLMRNIFREGGFTEMVCEDCADEYEECPHCGELTENRTICLACGAVIDEKEETA